MNHALYTARIVIVALVAPLLLAAAALIVTFPLAAAMPARVAVHWDLSGHVNGYGSPFEFPIGIAASCFPLIAIFGGAVVLLSHRGPLTPLMKILAVSSMWLTVVISVTFASVLLYPGAGKNPGPTLAVALGAATLVGVGAWFVLPRGVRGIGGSVRPAVEPVALAPGERASWIRTTSASAALIWVLVGTCVVLAAGTAALTLATAGQSWAFSFVPIGVLLVVLSNFAWTVRIDSRGVFVRSVLGIPFVRIPLDQITTANVTDVQPVAQYGGWGIRWALNGRLGIIVRSGEALEVHRTKGLTLVVTIDDASSAAALISGLVKRAGTSLP